MQGLGGIEAVWYVITACIIENVKLYGLDVPSDNRRRSVQTSGPEGGLFRLNQNVIRQSPARTTSTPDNRVVTDNDNGEAARGTVTGTFTTSPRFTLALGRHPRLRTYTRSTGSLQNVRVKKSDSISTV